MEYRFSCEMEAHVEVTISSVSEINKFFCILRRNSKWPPKVAGKNNFWEKSPVDSADTLWVKNFVKIALSRSVSKINPHLRLTQKFKMATKSGGKTIFGKRHQ